MANLSSTTLVFSSVNIALVLAHLLIASFLVALVVSMETLRLPLREGPAIGTAALLGTGACLDAAYLFRAAADV